jgi:hypothetical protein
MKLTDMQRVLLSPATKREDRRIVVPANLKGPAARKVIERMISDGVIEECRKPAR